MKFKSPKNRAIVILLALGLLMGGMAYQYSVSADDVPPSGITASEDDLPVAVDEAARFEQGDRHVAAENDLRIKTSEGEIQKFNIELALRPDEQAKGLMFRNSMPEDHGMLFLFRTIEQRSFWMKNTLIPLDMIFIEADGRIQHIHHNAKPQDLTFITSGKPSKAILELNGGTANKLGIQVGDTVFHSGFRNLNLLDK